MTRTVGVNWLAPNLLVGGDRLLFRRVVALFPVRGYFRHVLRRVDLHRDGAPASIQLDIGGRVADRVMVSDIVRDALHDIFNLIEIFGKERLAAGHIRELDQIVLSLLRRRLLEQAAALVILFEQADGIESY